MGSSILLTYIPNFLRLSNSVTVSPSLTLMADSMRPYLLASEKLLLKTICCQIRGNPKTKQMVREVLKAFQRSFVRYTQDNPCVYNLQCRNIRWLLCGSITRQRNCSENTLDNPKYSCNMFNNIMKAYGLQKQALRMPAPSVVS